MCKATAQVIFERERDIRIIVNNNKNVKIRYYYIGQRGNPMFSLGYVEEAEYQTKQEGNTY